MKRSQPAVAVFLRSMFWLVRMGNACALVALAGCEVLFPFHPPRTPPEPLLTLPFAHGLYLTPQHAYVTTSDFSPSISNQVVQFDLVAKVPKLLASSEPPVSLIATVDNTAFWTTWNPASLRACDVTVCDGTPATRNAIVEDKFDPFDGIAASGFALASEDGRVVAPVFGTGAVYETAPSGPTRVIVPPSSPATSVTNAVLHDGDLFWTDQTVRQDKPGRGGSM